MTAMVAVGTSAAKTASAVLRRRWPRYATAALILLGVSVALVSTGKGAGAKAFAGCLEQLRATS